MSPRRLIAAALGVLGLAAATAHAEPMSPTVPERAAIVVNSTSDAAAPDPAGDVCDTGAVTATGAPECTLRAAIVAANAAPGPDTIRIAVSSWDLGGGTGVVRIAPATPLPAVTGDLIIDGSATGPSLALTPARVEFDGSQLAGATALEATAPTTIRAVTLTDFAVAGPVTLPAAPTTPGAPVDEPVVTPDPGATTPPGSTPTPSAEPDPTTTPAPAPSPQPPQPAAPSATPDPSIHSDPGGTVILGVAAVVNSSRDAPDALPGDGICSTGAAVSVDEDECTLRAAMQEADASALIDTIVFAIPRGDFGHVGATDPRWVIRPATPLPPITTRVTIDAAGQQGAVCADAGATPSPAVLIDAGAASVGLRIRAGGVVVRGLAIDGAATAVRIEGGPGGVTLICNRLGVDASGTAPTAGLTAAVHIDSSPGDRVGGIAAGEANLLGSGTRGAVRITGAAATGTTVIGNTVIGAGEPVIAAGAAVPAGDPPAITAAASQDGVTTLSVASTVAPGAYRLEILAVRDGAGGATVTTPVAVRSVQVAGAPDVLTASIPAPASGELVAMLTSDPSGPGLAATSLPSGGFSPLSISQVSGTVLEDVNGDGAVADDGSGVDGVDVQVFSDQGNGRPDAGDPVVAATRTGPSGAWSVTVPADGLYWAAVDSRDIAPAAGLLAGYTAEDVWAEQTYAGAGAARFDGSTWSFTSSAGALFGGARPAAGDGFPVLSAAEHVMRATVAGGDVSGLDTGFSFAAVTNTLDDPASGAFTDAASWSSFDADAAGIGVNPEGYAGSVFDGRYVYFSPSQRTGGRHGEVLRYDTLGAYSSAASWDSFDAGDAGVGSDPDGYAGAVFDGRYVYFAPDDNGTGSHGEVLRYDTAGAFGTAGSWSTFDAGANGVGTDPDGYSGAEFDGRYVYFAPRDDGTGPHGEVLRYDTTGGFGTAGSWSTFDAGANGVGTAPDGYGDVLYDGRYLYFAPLANAGGAHGEVMRYDTRAPFTTASSWTTYDPGSDGVGSDPDGFSALVSDGRYVYFLPSDAGSGPSGEVMRLDTTAPFSSAASWSTFDPGAAGLGSGAVGFSSGSFDGRFVHLAQQTGGTGPAGRVVRYDTRAPFGSVGSWSLFDPVSAGVGTDPEGARGTVFDGRRLYIDHGNNGTDFSSEVLQLDTARTGQGSLRRFITNSNAIAGMQASAFAIPATDPGYSASPASFTISPTAALPAAVDPVVIDASTQPGSGALGRPQVAIDGSGAGAGAGITLGAGSGASEIRGLAIGGFAGDGIRSMSDDDTIAGNWIGVALDGTTPAANGGVGVRVEGSGTTVGGSGGAIDRNVISANGDDGVRVAGPGATITGNRIGTDAVGAAAVTGGADGVDVRAAGAQVGGPSAGEGNVISGNAGQGVSLSAGSDGAVVQGNLIGLGADGATPVPNAGLGVWVDSSSNRIGGTAAGAGNAISANGGSGVVVNGTAADTAILGNAMESNGGLGIDLNAASISPSSPSDGATANDPGDADSGGNGLLNTPELGPMTESGGSASVDIGLDVPAGTYRIEFLANPAGADPSGSGEGGVLRGTTTVTHAGAGLQTFTRTIAVSAGDVITATATEASGPGATSEFSAPVTVMAGNDPPASTIAATATIAEDAPLAFDAGTATEISVNDPDAGGSPLAVTLTALNGRITLSGTTGLSFTAGDGTLDATSTFTGTLTEINAALDGAEFTPDAEFSGAASLRIDVDDQGATGAGGPMTDSDTLAIAVTGANDPPVQALPSAQTTAEDTPVTLSTGGGTAISVSDVDAGSAPVSVVLTGTNATMSLSGTAGLSFTAGDGVNDGAMHFDGALIDVNAALDGMVVTPATDFAGAASVRIRTDDLGHTGPGGPQTDDDTLPLTVTAVNDAPVNVVPAGQTVPGNTPLTFSAAGGDALGVTDADSASGAIQVALSATHGTLTLSGTTGLSFIAGDGTLDSAMTFTGIRADVAAALDGAVFLPASGFMGTATIAIDSDDGGATGAGAALTDSDSFTVDVTAAQSPPVLGHIGAKTVAEGSTLALTASATDPDLPSDTLTYSLLGAPAGATIDPVSGAFSWTPDEAQGPGAHTFAVVVTDADSPPSSDSETITIDVTEVNAGPAIDPIADRANGEGDAISLQPTGIDPDIPADSLTWSATGLPPGVSLDPATGAVTGIVTAGATAGSPYSVTVTLTDAAGLSSGASFLWTIALTNSAPVVPALAPRTVDEMTPVTATAHATDPDGDPLRYSLRDAPAGAAIDARTGKLTWTPGEAQGPDTVTIGVVATDDGTPAMLTERPLVVTVREVNRPPAVEDPPAQTVAAGDPLRVDAHATDPDRPHNRLSYTIAGPAGMTVGDDGTIRWTPGAGDVGEADARLTVTDDGTPARSATAKLHVAVTPAATAPSSPAAPQTPPSGGTPGATGSSGGTPSSPAPTTPAKTPTTTPAADPGTPAAPTPGKGPAGETPAQRASRRLGSGLLAVPPPPAAPRMPADDSRVGISLSTPVRVISAATELSFPLRMLALGGGWTSLILSMIVMRRRNRRPLMVVGIPTGKALPVMRGRSTEGIPRFLLRHDAGPVWSRGPVRRRRGKRWIEIETPLGPGFADADHLVDPPSSAEGQAGA